MIAFLVDQNFNEHILDGLIRRGLTAEFVHDRSTIPPFAYARITAGLPMPGVFLVNDHMPIGQAIDELLLAANSLTDAECQDQVVYFPL